MKSDIWPDDVSIPEMTDWLAELRDDGHDEPADDSYAPRTPESHPYPEPPAPAREEGPVPPGQADSPESMPAWTRILAEASPPSEASPPGWAWTRAVANPSVEAGTSAEADTAAEADPLGEAGPLAEADAPAEADASTEADAPAEADPSTEADAPAGADSSTEADAPAKITTRALIGDELRMPVMWCELGSCISRYSDPAACGEADIRARAIGAGWRVDAFGRLVCPHCQQTAAGFRVSRPVVLWDRRTAITKAARMAVTHGNGAPWGHARDPRRAASTAQPGRHRGRPAAEAMPYGPQAR
jgi:hypothetical protein